MNSTEHSVVALPDHVAAEAESVQQFAATLCCVTFETILGMRPLAQLLPLVTAQVATRISARSALTCNAVANPGHQANLALRQLHTNVRVVRTLACRVTAGVYEVSVVIAERVRHRAVALRIEARHGKWCVTSMEIG